MVRKITYHSVIGLLLLMVEFMTGGCQKLPLNGDLDGEWEVIEVIPSPPANGIDTRYFYNFSRHVCQLTVYGNVFTVGNLVYDEDTMTLDFPYIRTPEEKLTLKQYGIYENPVSFNVYFETKTRLILSNEDVSIILKKF